VETQTSTRYVLDNIKRAQYGSPINKR